MAKSSGHRKGVSKGATSKQPASVSVLQLPGITPDQLHNAKLLPLSRNLIYAACNTGEIECFRIGRKIVIVTAALRRKLGLEAA
jgi:hypothetical protein